MKVLSPWSEGRDVQAECLEGAGAGGHLFSDIHNCVHGTVTQGSPPEIVQSGNHRVGTVNWVAQTYPA